MNPSFYKTAQAPTGYGTDWLVRFQSPDQATTDAINRELSAEPGTCLYLTIESEDEARYWAARFLKLNANRFEDYPAYTLLVVSVNLTTGLVTFKQSALPQGHNAYLDPATGEVAYYTNPPLYDAVSF